MKTITFSAALIAAASLFSSKAYAQEDASFDFSKANNYVLIYLDEESSSQIPSGTKVTDYRTDDVNNALWIWSDTYTANNAVGPNSNGVPGAFLDFTVNNGGWSGFGFAGIETGPGKDMTKVTDEHYLHFALKSTDKDTQIIGISGGAREGKINISDAPYNDNGTIIDAYENFTRDGEWYSFDIPVKDLKKLGASFESTAFYGNSFFLLSGGRKGCNICVDAIFYYTKTSTSINESSIDSDNIIIGEEFINVIDCKDGISLYDYTGKEVRTTSLDVLDIKDLKGGIYILKTGNTIKKINIR